MGALWVGGWQRVSVLVGFAVVTGVLSALAPLPAMSQILDPAAHHEPPSPRRPPATPEDYATSITRDIDEAFFGDRDGSFAPEVSAAPAPSDGQTEGWVTGTQEAVAADDAASEGADGEPIRRSPVLRDGDPVAMTEAAEEVTESAEGVIDINAPNPFSGEEDLTRVDLRSPRDITGLGPGSAGFDPLLLQAEETNPVFTNGPLSAFEPEPFLPLGTRLGSFTLFSSLEADGDYNSNLFASPVALGDYSLEVRPAARLVSNWSTHAVEVRASGDLSYHDKYPTEDDRAYLLEGLGRLDVTRRTNLQGFVSREYAQESRNAINATSIGTRPNITVDRARAAVNHRFNRLSVQLRGAIVDTSYSTDVIDGVVESNADRDYILYEEAFRPQWELTPTLFLFSDIAFNQRDYAIPAFTDGIIRSSTGERYRVGVSFGTLGEFLRGEVSLGYGRQTPDNHVLEVIDGLLVDGNLTWRPTPITSVLFTASSDVAETTTDDSGGVMERTYGLEVRHSFETRLVGTAGLGDFTRDFVGAGIHENQLTAATGLEYFLSRYAVLFSRYQHTVFESTSPNSSYTVEEVQLGVRLRQ